MQAMLDVKVSKSEVDIEKHRKPYSIIQRRVYYCCENLTVYVEVKRIIVLGIKNLILKISIYIHVYK